MYESVRPDIWIYNDVVRGGRMCEYIGRAGCIKIVYGGRIFEYVRPSGQMKEKVCPGDRMYDRTVRGGRIYEVVLPNV